MVNKQGQTRLSNYYDWLTIDERSTLEAEIIRKCLSRTEAQCSFMEYRGMKVVYRRYASLFFIVGVEADEEGGALRDATLACVNASGQIYQKGDFAKHMPKLPLDKYLAVKVGVFPDVYEAIANSHMDRGDATVSDAL